MSTLNNVLIIICIALGLGMFLNAYIKGKKVLRKIREQAYIRNLPIE
ncbi:hypothetical protein M2129_002094 [Polynucleobacter sphagniphilus]|jgi:hypothetical protein|nr:hypothetical protein [Polynucleobacter sphagniphilus]